MKDQRSNEELNAIIAKWCGMKETETVIASEYNGVTTRTPAWVVFNAKGEGLCSCSVRSAWAPRYCDDLNAIHEAEKKLFDYPSRQFSGGCSLMDDYDVELQRKVLPGEYRVRLTARQRAEALVSVIESSAL